MPEIAPEIAVTRWFNARTPLSLDRLRGKVVVIHAFQMLCPGCVAHALPQAERLYRLFAGRPDILVLGLHTVFEHHAAMTPIALEAFIHEYRLTFPIGVDQPGADGPIPLTMQRYRMQGTPTTIVIDHSGRIVEQAFGQVDDLALGALIGSLLARPVRAEPAPIPAEGCAQGSCAEGSCAEGGCPVPGHLRE